MVVLSGIIGILVIVIIGILLYYNQAFPEAQEIAEEMELINGDYWFHGDRDVGFIIFAGAKTDERAYAYMAKLLYEEGYTVVIPKQLFHLSAFGTKHGMEIMESSPQIEKWILIGHSLGGMPASRIAAAQPEKLLGIALLATYASVDLSALDISAIRITAENDGVMNNERMENYNGNLPENSVNIMLKGTNHQGFAAYKSASGRDGEASISWQEQNEQSVKLILEFFEGMENSSEDIERAAQIIDALGEDSQQYLTLNAESSYFFGAEACGAVPYTLTGRRSMSQGDPACRAEDMACLLDEYLAFCQKSGYRAIFNSVSADVAELLRQRDFCVLQYGEEAILDLNSYSLSGAKKGALRRNVAKLNRAGITLEEYCPETARDPSLEKELSELEEQWFADKKLKLTYSVGGLQFEKTYGRRYFVTRNPEGQILTVLSFLPYRQRKAYCVDVMYRKLDGPTGAMEHAIISAAMKMKDEGLEEVSLNIAPLAGIDIAKPDTCRTEKLMYEIFNNMDFDYDFKNLYRFKSKFDPSAWKTRYLVYDRRIPVVRLATSITNTKGAADVGLYMKYKKFFVSLFLFPNRYREYQK